jgi:hypothetical protein
MKASRFLRPYRNRRYIMSRENKAVIEENGQKYLERTK